jgi:hypothetical protein
MAASACAESSQPLANGTLAVSCCAPDRKPAVDAEGNVNFLCAECAPGLAQVKRKRVLSGRVSHWPMPRARPRCQVGNACVKCDSVNVPMVLVLLLGSLLVVIVFHRV